MVAMWSEGVEAAALDAGLHLYRAPRVGASLVEGWKEDKEEEEEAKAKAVPPAPVRVAVVGRAPVGPLQAAHVVTYRHCLILIASAPYETRRPFRIRVARRDGRIELDVVPPRRPEKQTRAGYMGRQFERLCRDEPDAPGAFNAMLMAGYDEINVLMGAEIDAAVQRGMGGSLPLLEHLVELKTHRVLDSDAERDEFCRRKLLMAYLQAFLAGVPKVVIGFRNDEGGTLDSFEMLETATMHRYGSSGERNFDPWICLRFLRNVLRMLLQMCAEEGKRYMLELKRPFTCLELREEGQEEEEEEAS